MTDESAVKCGKCKVPLVGPENPKPDDMFSCPTCGASDRYDKILEEVKRQVTGAYEKAVTKAFGPGSGWKLTRK